MVIPPLIGDPPPLPLTPSPSAPLPPQHRSTQASLEAAEEVNGKAVPQLEQLKWQARQHQKKVDDITCAQQEAVKVWGRV